MSSYKRKSLPKKVRMKIFEEYDGHCAYCGCKLDYKDMQIDHINSVYRSIAIKDSVDECMGNYMPSCRQCNFYKSTFTLEAFRRNLTDVLMKNLQKNFNYRLALKYGLIQEDIKPIMFYFEKTEGSND